MRGRLGREALEGVRSTHKIVASVIVGEADDRWR
jgi:hypothetical protein